MVNIIIKNKLKTLSGWSFIVELKEVEDILMFDVTLDEDHYIDLTKRQIPPEEIVSRSFTYLLRRQNKNSILKKFNIHDIIKFYPDFEEMIKVA